MLQNTNIRTAGPKLARPKCERRPSLSFTADESQLHIFSGSNLFYYQRQTRDKTFTICLKWCFLFILFQTQSINLYMHHTTIHKSQKTTFIHFNNCCVCCLDKKRKDDPKEQKESKKINDLLNVRDFIF